MGVYQNGNTIRLQCTFRDFGGALVDPTVVKVKFYDYRYTQFSEFILTSTNKISMGVYYLDYVITTPNNQLFYYEWYGEIGGMPAIKRALVETTFV